MFSRRLATFSFNSILSKMKSTDSVIAKIDPSKMDRIVTPELVKVIDLFKKHNHELRIAGGAVRDLLSGEKFPDDVDLATTATPTEMKEIFEKESIRMINELGEKHGTITARIDDKVNFEITTLRIDKVTDGRRAEVEFTKDWRIDAERRDLTINSMFLDFDGTVIDYFNGHQDLQNQRVAFVGDPVRRIQEDYLRILRYFRFHGRICKAGNHHEDETMKAIKDNAKGLTQVAGERIWMEWKKILSGPNGGPLTLKMVELGVGPFIGLPENPNSKGFQALWEKRKNSVHYVTLLAQLLNTPDEMTQLNMRLKMSGYERDLGYFIINHRQAPLDLKYWQHILVFTKHKPFQVKEWIEQVLLCLDDDQNLYDSIKGWEIPKFPIGGKELKDEGVPGGKIIGFCLERLKEMWFESDFAMDTNHLLKVELPKVMDLYVDTTPKNKKGGKQK